MKTTSPRLTSTRRAIRLISAASIQRDYKSLVNGAERAIQQQDRRLLQLHLDALATITHGLRLTLSKKIAFTLLIAIFEDAASLKVRLKTSRKLDDQVCSVSGPTRGTCVYKRDFTCIEGVLGDCISTPS